MQGKIQEIEIFRGFAALAVVLIHVSAFYLQPMGDHQTFLFISAFNTLPKFAVQAFIFISGMVLFYSYSQREYKITSFYLKRLKHLLLPYAFWTTVYLLVRKGFLSKPFTDQLVLFKDNFFSGQASYHLYFILLIVQFYVLFPLLEKLFKKIQLGKILLVIAGIVYLGLMYLDYYSSLNSFLPKSFLLIRSRLFVYWYFYFLLGAYAGLHLEKWQETIGKWGLPSGFLMLATWGTLTYEYYFSVISLKKDYGMAATPLKPSIFIYTILCIILLYALASYLVSKGNGFTRFFSTAGKLSLGIYFAHPLVLQYIGTFKISEVTGINFACTYVLTVALSWGFTMLFAKNKQTALVMGTA